MSTRSFLLLFCFFAASCTKDSAYRPSLEKYKQDTDLMIHVAGRLNEERDAKAMHRTIIGLQASRVIACDDFKNECNIFNDYIKIALEASEGDKLPEGTQAKLRGKFDELLKAVESGREELKAEH